MKFVKSVTLLSVLITAPVFAGSITLQLEDEYVSGNTKYCIYSDSQRTFSVKLPSSRSCPNTKTFEI